MRIHSLLFMPLAMLTVSSVAADVGNVVFHDDFEGAMLAKAPSFSLRELFSGSFTEDFEDYITDQFPFRDNWLDLKSRTERSSGKTENNGVFFCREDTLISRFQTPSESALDSAQRAVDSLINHATAVAQPHRIAANVNDLLDDLISQSVALVGKPVAMMNKEDKIRAIHFLNDAGAFLITKSGDKVTKYFGISKFTLYSYIDAKLDDEAEKTAEKE